MERKLIFIAIGLGLQSLSTAAYASDSLSAVDAHPESALQNATSTSAQDAQASGSDSAAPSAKTLDSVTVTAQRREQGLLDVPLSLSAITSETLQAQGIESITDLRFNTPGLVTNTGSGYVQTFIRGIGNRIQIGVDPSVTTFIDDVPRVYASLVDDLSNVARVEVLKGAQGGLYGRNATAGVINIHTRQPDSAAFAAEARISYGSKNTVDVNGYLNIPLGTNAAIDLTVAKKTHDSYIDNQAISNPYASYAALSAAEALALGDTGQRAYLLANPQVAANLDGVASVSELSNQDMTFAEAKLLFQGENYKVRFAVDSTDKDDADGNAWKSLQLTRVYGTYTALMNGSGLSAARLPFNYLYPGSTDNRYGKYQAAGAINAFTKLRDYGGSAKVDIDRPGYTLTSITAFRWNESDFRNDVTGSAVPAAGFEASFHRRNVYQELRAVSSNEGPFRWLAGTTYYKESIDNSTATIILGNTLSPSLVETGGDGYSAYFQGEYDVTNRVSLIGSLRYVDETKSAEFPASAVAIFDPLTNTIQNGVSVPAFSAEDNVTKLLPALTISYALEGGGNLYARWAKGLKTGGVNPLVHPAQTLNVLNSVGPEQVDTYELGLRTWLLDRKIQLTSAIFYNDYRDLQVLKSGYTGLAAFYLNAGQTKTYGADAAVNWKVNQYVTLSTGLSYLDAKYTDFAYAGLPELRIAGFDVSGNRMIIAPKWQAYASINLEVPVNDNWNAVGSLLGSYMSDIDTDDSNAAIVRQAAYSLFNLRLGLQRADAKYGVYLAADNLMDKEYITWGSLAPSAYNVQLGAPRIVSAKFEVRF